MCHFGYLHDYTFATISRSGKTKGLTYPETVVFHLKPFTYFNRPLPLIPLIQIKCLTSPHSEPFSFKKPFIFYILHFLLNQSINHTPLSSILSAFIIHLFHLKINSCVPYTTLLIMTKKRKKNKKKSIDKSRKSLI